MRSIFIAAAGALLLFGCMSTGEREGVAESGQSATTATVSGGLLEADAGQALDERDRQIAAQAEYRALEYGRAGQPVSWRGESAAGNYGEIAVGPGYEVNRLDCREYTHTVYVGGRAQVSRGTACREPSGNWRAVS